MAALRLTVAVWLQGANGHCAINDIPMHMVHRCPPPSYILHLVDCVSLIASHRLHLVDCISLTASRQLPSALLLPHSMWGCSMRTGWLESS